MRIVEGGHLKSEGAKSLLRDGSKVIEVVELDLPLGDAEIGTFEGGTVTYKESQRKEYTVKASTYRQLRVKVQQ